ncbi:hypothetical protein CFBP6624_23100 [Agrobacterium tumefaciens]|uniref:Uncharacterized protein n=1 Tax=Agrobacterium tumefaciens TaxID=358 RepID=A0AAE6BS42_AGRTU|nr:hypothetical protein CFBP6624_23100 [Agrobacterium tumefaciens]
MPGIGPGIDVAHEIVFPTLVLQKKLTKPDNHVQSVEQFLCTALQMRKCIYFGRACASMCWARTTPLQGLLSRMTEEG